MSKISSNLNELMLTVKRKYKIDQEKQIFFGSQTYFEEIVKEVEEAKIEFNNNKQVYLEDELADILWDYLNLLINLENEKKISLEKVFERANKKYKTRIDGIEKGILWSEIKKIQKKELQQEQDNLIKF